jgi:oxygen-dependent protoporphyrinogen oxidase
MGRKSNINVAVIGAGLTGLTTAFYLEKARQSKSEGDKKATGEIFSVEGGLGNLIDALFLSSFLKNKAPEQGALLSVFIGGVRKPEMSELTDDEIIQIVKEEISEMFQLPEFNPGLLKIFRYRHAIPQYGFESEEKMKTIDRLETQYPGLILAGNIRDGIGIADRVKQGKTIATQLTNKYGKEK